MSTQNDGWIRFIDRQPTAEEFKRGVVAGSYRNGEWSKSSIFENARWDKDRTHFMVIHEPPKKEMTQAELDSEAFTNACGLPIPFHSPQMGHAYISDVWHRALAYRDAQNREDLERIGMPLMHTDAMSIYANLRRRAGMEAKK